MPTLVKERPDPELVVVPERPEVTDFIIRPHVQAPVLSSCSSEEASLIITQLLSETESSTFSLSKVETVHLIREASLVNLFFFLSGVLATVGPYEKLNTGLHLDMCNFRQSDHCMLPGTRNGIFTTRGFYKTSIGTHGANQWEIIRFPAITIRLVNAVIDRAVDFLDLVRIGFSENPIMWILFPELCVKNPKGGKEFSVPQEMRGRFSSVPTIKAGGATGSSEGDHHLLFNGDDIAGLEELDFADKATADMEKKCKWLDRNEEALLTTPMEGRVALVGTRYGPSDPYERRFKDCRKFVGFQPSVYRTTPTGKWVIYYRKGRENGVPTCPDILDEDELTRLQEKERWYWLTQVQNEAYDESIIEFINFDTKRGLFVDADYKDEFGKVTGTELLATMDVEWDPNDPSTFRRLADMDVVAALDPAITETGISAKACKTALSVWARDWDGVNFLVYLEAGYWGMHQLYDEVFKMAALFEDYLRCVVFEANAFQRVLGGLFRDEMERRNKYFTVEPFYARGDKVARIKSTLGTELAPGRIVCCGRTKGRFDEEKDIFPQAKYQMDILDSSHMAIGELQEPENPEDQEWYEQEENEYVVGKSKKTGY